MKNLIAALCLTLTPHVANADMADDLEDLVGYTIAESKTIAGWYDEDGDKGDSFEGCEHGRTIVFTDDRVLTCAQYGYQFAYRATAVILVKGSSYKMVVEDEIYDMRR